MQPTRSNTAHIEWNQLSNDSVVLKSTGDWETNRIGDAAKMLEKFSRRSQNLAIKWDVSDIGVVDSSGMMLFIHYYDQFKSSNCTIEIVGADDKHAKMYQLLRRYAKGSKQTEKLFSGHKVTQFLNDIGKKTEVVFFDILILLAFIGEHFVNLLYSILHPGTIRFAAIVKNIEEAGLRALPIIALTSFLIGVVIAYQGAVQLEKFGANIFIVDMIGISVTRELAPLITAIVVAGRTGSSYTAQLGVMKITEEIDAMQTMGFDPHRFLVLPRIIALMIALPLLIFFADIVSIAAGMFISNIHLNLSYIEFIHRLQAVLDVKHVWIGIIKGPVFAWLIAMVGCFRGFQVSKNTESIGRYTTISVVNSIFLVIAIDALFSVLLTDLGI